MKKGDKVNYTPTNENGIVKLIAHDNACFVVFHCNDDWEDYENYTGQHCRNKDLIKGWQQKQEECEN